ncbi:MAG TPA: type I methionyl aminopeptidase [Chloroflexota bacterium]|jgi:methionyl aminopeptidase|nr:type I methionyl aminopeptidase [Chloroflexota bacterium]
MPRRAATPARIPLRTAEELAGIRAAAQVVARVLAELRAAVRPGIRTRDLERLAAEAFRRLGARSGTLGYFGFPGQLCISVNDEVVHGIPGPRRLAAGDLVKLDVVAVKDGFYGDAAISVPVGPLRPEVERLVRVTEEALWAGIAQAHPGHHVGDIGHAIERHVAAHGLTVVREFVGHGIGRAMHEPPQVPNFGEPGTGPLLRPGMVLAIEPQVNLGTAAVRILADGWTAVTADGAWSAHFEHTVAITADGPEVLTRLG